MKKFVATTLALLLLAGCASASNKKSANIKTGLGVITSIESSTDATAGKDGNAQVDSVIAAVTLDADGKLAKVYLDSAQTKIGFNATGLLTTDKTSEVKTKKEIGTGYGMVKASKIGKEWYQQAEAFESWATGKTVDEVNKLKVKQTDAQHTAVPDVAELTSSVTISVGDFQKAIAKAAANAK
ncbi:MAG: hypothetical protein Q8865_01365 [Bacillota bacterium]|nr:hypothetical protein [Bacillota bacterium]